MVILSISHCRMEAISAQLVVLNKELADLGEKIEKLNARLLDETDEKKEKLENQIKQREERKEAADESEE